MKILVIADQQQKEELLKGASNPEMVTFISFPGNMEQWDADVIIDLLYDHSPDRISLLKKLLPATIIVNSVSNKTDNEFVRVNGWPTFLERKVIEAYAGNEVMRAITEKVARDIGKEVIWTEDIEGFITPRVICMIINEAYIALGENISTRDEIDTAMKLGTNYPYGPFEWANLIGVEKIGGLLKKLQVENERYAPSEILLKEVAR